jgi:hypothetical protein
MRIIVMQMDGDKGHGISVKIDFCVRWFQRILNFG